MTDLKIKRLRMRNWMKFRDVDLTFPETGLVLVRGCNSASNGALLSVGSGKTGLGEALSRTLMGVSGRFANLKQYSSDKGGDTYVVVDAMLHGKPLTVESGYKCEEMSRTGEALRFTYDGNVVERGSMQHTRAELTKLLGVPELLASWTVFVDGDSIKFNKLSQADCVELVMTSLRQPPWSAYHEISKKALGAFRHTLTASETKYQQSVALLTTAEAAVKSVQAIVASEEAEYQQLVRDNDKKMKELAARIKKHTDEMLAFETRKAAIKKQLADMEKQRAEATHKLEIKMHEVNESVLAAEESRNPLQADKMAKLKEVTEAKLNLKNYESAASNCPTCKRPMGKIDPERLSHLKTLCEHARQAYEKANNAWTDAEQRVVSLSEEYRTLASQQRKVGALPELAKLSDEYEMLEEDSRTMLTEIQNMELTLKQMEQGPSDAEVRIAKARLKDKKEAVQTAKLDVQSAEECLNIDRSTIRVYEYWNLAFSPYGIPNMVLKKVVDPLNTEAQRISAAMTGQTISVKFKTVREMANGMEKAQLNVEIKNLLGGSELSGSSKGEAGLTNFIVAETLSEVGQVSRRTGYRWYDEIVPHQDPTVCNSIYAYMRDLAQRLGILVFLVDHNPDAANYAHHVLTVEKKNTANGIVSEARWS